MEHCDKPPPPDPATATQVFTHPSCTLGPEHSHASYLFSGDTDTNMLTDVAWIGADDGGEGRGLGLPENNQSLSSSSGEDPPENSIAFHGKQLETPSKSKKKQKQMRQPRFAFMTKSETHHLEDGYRWRKYGQKAVKNSPFPRSYYRCTNSKCTVKKRVERSYEDPTIVITTYEGQHCHHTAGIFNRGGMISHEATFASQFSLGMSQLYYPIQLPGEDTRSCVSQPCQAHDIEAGRCSTVLPDSTREPPTDDGLLGDIVPRQMRSG